MTGCSGNSPCDFQVESFRKYLIITITNTSPKNAFVSAQGQSVAIAVKKKMGSWTYDLNNLTSISGKKKILPGEVIKFRKFISKYDKQYKYKLELVCNNKKIESEEFKLSE
ncbi:MAG: hypothetical protein HN576_09300 [Bacteriovoracaceae bacterium]|mgnify:CR=1 FL=1|jgi:hypothetical protein|nr:hypothetical protein [Bacteriovoracaceae bacterium]